MVWRDKNNVEVHAINGFADDTMQMVRPLCLSLIHSLSGCGDSTMDEANKKFTLAGKEYHEGDCISLDGSTGNIYDGITVSYTHLRYQTGCMP